jgi:hypothetical protein
VAKAKRTKIRKAKEPATSGSIAEALEAVVKGLDGIADKIGDVVTELDRAASAAELDGDVGEKPLVEQVWIVCVVGLACDQPGAISVRASERSARDILKDRIEDDEHMMAVAKNSMLHDLAQWDGQSDVTIGSWRIRVETVNL